MDDNKVYLSFGRHGRYGAHTAIEHTSMLEAYLSGRNLSAKLPECQTVFYSPIPRAVQTAKFRGLGLGCRRFSAQEALKEETATFTIRQLVNSVIQSAEPEERHFHFVTHQPVIEKLGLPELDTCGICICAADSWTDMLSENYEVSRWPAPTIDEMHSLLQAVRIEPEDLEKFSPDGVYSALSRIK